MGKLMKADMFRIKRSKAIYIVPIFIVLFVLLSCSIFLALQSLTSSDMINGLVGETGMTEMIPMEAITYSGYDMTMVNLQSDTLIYALIAIFLLVSAVDFSSGTVKNLLTSGITKKQIYVSKLMNSLWLTFIYFIIYVVSSVVFSYLLFDGTLDWKVLADVGLVALKQLPIYFGIISAGHMFVFMSQKVSISVVAYIVTFMMFNTLLPMVNMILDLPFNFTLLFPLYQCIELTKTGLTVTDYLVIYGSTVVYLLVSWLVGYFRFKKAEIK